MRKVEKITISSSIINADGLNSFLQSNFEFSEFSTCKLLKTGINHTYKIEDKGKSFIYRIYSYGWRSKLEISEEIRFIDILNKNEVSVSFAIADKQQQKIQEIKAPEGIRYGVLYSFATGRKIEQLAKEKHVEIGKILGRIHEISGELKLERVTYTLNYLLEDSLAKIKRFLAEDCEEVQYLEYLKEEICNAVQKKEGTFLREGAVHLDIWSDNFHVNDNGNITLFDFDFCGNGPLILDVSYYILQLINLERDEDKCIDKINAFIYGYKSVSNISNEEKAMLQHFGLSLYFFYLGVQCERFENWSNIFLNESYLKKYINLVVRRFHNFKYWT